MIGSISVSNFTATVSTVSQSSGTSCARCSPGADSATSAGDKADISGPGKLFSELKQLASQDPAKFKQVAADIAAKLKEAAGSDASGTAAAGGVANSFLSNLAAKFDTAAQTGDVSGLQPPAGSGHHHHHHGGHHGQVSGAYNQQGVATPSVPASQGTDLRSLFDSINKEVVDALSSLSSPA